MESVNKRDYVIYFMQTFCIIFVVLEHSFYKYNTTHEESIIIGNWTCSFLMPAFYFISGYLLKYTTERKSIDISSIKLYGSNGYITKKTKRLIVPYILLSSMAFFPKALMSDYTMRAIDLSFESYFRMLIYPYENVIGFFWFLPTTFIIFFFFIYIEKIKKISIPILITFLITINLIFEFNKIQDTILNISKILYYLIYFTIGFYFCMKKINISLEKYSKIIAPVTFAFSIIFILYIPNTIRGYYIMTSLNGILMCIALGQIYVKRNYHFLNHLYGATYTIYLLSWFPQVASQQVLLSIINVPWIITTIIALFSGIYLPLIVYKWTMNHRTTTIGKIVAFFIGIV